MKLSISFLVLFCASSAFAFQAKHVYDVTSTQFAGGAQGNGSHPDLSAFQAAFDAAASDLQPGASVYIPCGKYMLGGTIAITMTHYAALKVRGEGSDCTLLVFQPVLSDGGMPQGGSANMNGLVVYYSGPFSSVSMSDFTVTTTNATLDADSTGAAISLVYQSANPNAAKSAQSSITNVTIRGDNGYAGTNLWPIGVNISGVSNVNIYGLNYMGVESGHSVYYGVGATVHGVGPAGASVCAINFSNSFFYAFHTGIQYGSGVQGMAINQTNFTRGSTGVLVPPQGDSLDQLFVTNSQFGSMTTAGIYMQSVVNSTSLANNFFIVPSGANAVVLDSQLFTIVGNTISGVTPTSTNGIYMQAAPASVGNGVITGNAFDNLTVGTYLPSATTNITVRSNTYHSVGTPVLNYGTGNIIGPTGAGFTGSCNSCTCVDGSIVSCP